MIVSAALSSKTPGEALTGGEDISGIPTGDSDTIYALITNVIEWLLGILALLGVLGFVFSGFLYLTAAGDQERISKAKNAMIYSIVGVAVGLLGYIAVRTVMDLIGA